MSCWFCFVEFVVVVVLVVVLLDLGGLVTFVYLISFNGVCCLILFGLIGVCFDCLLLGYWMTCFALFRFEVCFVFCFALGLCVEFVLVFMFD